MSKRGSFVIEQVTRNGDVIEDYDHILSPNELKKELLEVIPNSYIKDNHVYVTHNNSLICFEVKNISYLGNPHPKFKKRIQISNQTKSFINANKKLNIRTRILGMYSFDDSILICDFNTDDYIDRKLNNSSAHIYTLDLQRGRINGYFEKTDFNDNKITVFDSKNVMKYLDSITGNVHNHETNAISILDEFFESIDTKWEGIYSYQQMIVDNFSDKYQAEWPGFFLEYKFKKFLNARPSYSKYVEYRKSKSNDQIDLDLYFGMLNAYGDLKMHSTTSSGVLGNDSEVVSNLIVNSRIWYVVCEHETTKDKDRQFEVTEQWNTWLLKENLHSYGEKMKNSIEITRYYILEINSSNSKHLSVFNQGHNSNGKARNPKISIGKRDIGNFLIHSKKLD